jgi:hypothetical protein
LTREELYFGVQALSDRDPEPWSRDEITSELMERFIVNCSRGLVEVTESEKGIWRSSSSSSRVQFIHESVRDYLFDGGLELIAPEISNNLTGVSHGYLKQSCLKLFSASLIHHIPHMDRLIQSPDTQTRRDVRRHLMNLFPLLCYAWNHVIAHASIASQGGVSQAEFVSSFPYQIWRARIGKVHEAT